jgi:hypothetical protein
MVLQRCPVLECGKWSNRWHHDGHRIPASFALPLNPEWATSANDKICHRCWKRHNASRASPPPTLPPPPSPPSTSSPSRLDLLTTLADLTFPLISPSSSSSSFPSLPPSLPPPAFPSPRAASYSSLPTSPSLPPLSSINLPSSVALRPPRVDVRHSEKRGCR